MLRRPLFFFTSFNTSFQPSPARERFDLPALGAILIGLSRKSLIEELTIDNFKYRRINKKTVNPSKRLSGSVAFAMHAVNNGVQIIRTHDVFETNQAIICQRALT